jgi:uncharacterized membrane protein
MDFIRITVPGTELEDINITLTNAEVAALYQGNKDKSKKIEELEKSVKSKEDNNKYLSEAKAELQKELKQAHTLLTVLGVVTETEGENSWDRTKLEISTRIALYIANKQGN